MTERPNDEPLALPSPCVVVLVGPVASGKSTWARRWFEPAQIVSSDALRALVGEAEHDLAASTDAFELLDDVVARRLRRRLTTVIDTLGLDADQRRRWRERAAAAGMPCVAVVFDTAAQECRRRNSGREIAVRADVVANQLRRWPDVRSDVAAEAWHDIVTPDPVALVPAALAPTRSSERAPLTTTSPGSSPSASPSPDGMRIGLQLSSFEWPGGPAHLAENLERIVTEAEAAGVEHVWVMDHLRQIPQVGPAWQNLPEPYTTLAWLAGVTERIRLGVLVSPAFLRHPAVLADAVATLDVLSNGRAICGLGLGWFAQEYAALGIEFPSRAERYARLEDALRLLPLMWGKGSPRFEGRTVFVEEAMCYPRPLQAHVPIWVGGSGERKTLRLVAELADACNLFGEPDVVRRKVAILHRHCDEVGRDPAAIEVSHLSTVLVGRDRGDVSELVDRLRPKRRPAERFASDVNAGTIDDHLARIERYRESGVGTMILSVAGTGEPGVMERLGLLVDRLR
ncbi:MAG TPA: TIGR03560 family F420-dependent LLM class oxidoreductase [Ilumatobacteraceae bacterium]|nr:TIGR03560 family F420-dependent LLM class oxidoreductase [Ilumatobacteraceae bacterium]